MKMNQEASLELNDKVLFKDLKICKSEEKKNKTLPSNTYCAKGEKAESSYS